MFGHWRRGPHRKTYTKEQHTGRAIEARDRAMTYPSDRFCVVDGNGAAAAPANGGWVMGVVVAAQRDSSGPTLADGTGTDAGGFVGVQIDGVVLVEASGAITLGSALQTGADGRVAPEDRLARRRWACARSSDQGGRRDSDPASMNGVWDGSACPSTKSQATK